MDTTSHNHRKWDDTYPTLPKSTEWEDFLSNGGNMRQLVHLLADFILGNAEKEVFVTKNCHCFHKQTAWSILGFQYMQCMHSRMTIMCVVSNDTEDYILLLLVSNKC